MYRQGDEVVIGFRCLELLMVINVRENILSRKRSHMAWRLNFLEAVWFWFGYGFVDLHLDFPGAARVKCETNRYVIYAHWYMELIEVLYLP